MTAGATTQEIKDSFDALTLILVFVTVLFGIKYPNIWKDIRSQAPPDVQPIARKNYRVALQHRLLTDSIPLVTVTGCAWFLFLPLFIHVAADEPFHPWSTDVTQNAFLFIAGLTGVFFVWSGGLAATLLMKVIRSR
jgi:hypothetical protein